MMGHVPPPPVVAANPVIDLPKLNVAYEWMALDKVVGFKLVIEWYTTNQVALLWKDPLDVDRQKTMAKAQLAVNQGNGTLIEHEKLAAWRTAIRLFEKLWAHKMADWPLVDKIEAAPIAVSPHVLNIQAVLANLTAAFPAGCRFRVTLNSDQEYRDGEILLPQAELFTMITQSPLTIALTLAKTVAKVLASAVIVDDAEKGKVFLQKLDEVLAHIAAWAGAENAGKGVNKPVGKAAKAAGPKAPKVPGAAKAPKVPKPNAPPPIFDNQVISLTGMSTAKLKGHRATVFALITNGMTVLALRNAAVAKYSNAPDWKGRSKTVLQALVTLGVITIA